MSTLQTRIPIINKLIDRQDGRQIRHLPSCEGIKLLCQDARFKQQIVTQKQREYKRSQSEVYAKTVTTILDSLQNLGTTKNNFTTKNIANFVLAHKRSKTIPKATFPIDVRQYLKLKKLTDSQMKKQTTGKNGKKSNKKIKFQGLSAYDIYNALNKQVDQANHFYIEKLRNQKKELANKIESKFLKKLRQKNKNSHGKYHPLNNAPIPAYFQQKGSVKKKKKKRAKKIGNVFAKLKLKTQAKKRRFEKQIDPKKFKANQLLRNLQKAIKTGNRKNQNLKQRIFFTKDEDKLINLKRQLELDSKRKRLYEKQKQIKERLNYRETIFKLPKGYETDRRINYIFKEKRRQKPKNEIHSYQRTLQKTDFSRRSTSVPTIYNAKCMNKLYQHYSSKPYKKQPLKQFVSMVEPTTLKKYYANSVENTIQNLKAADKLGRNPNYVKENIDLITDMKVSKQLELERLKYEENMKKAKFNNAEQIHKTIFNEEKDEQMLQTITHFRIYMEKLNRALTKKVHGKRVNANRRYHFRIPDEIYKNAGFLVDKQYFDKKVRRMKHICEEGTLTMQKIENKLDLEYFKLMDPISKIESLKNIGQAEK